MALEAPEDKNPKYKLTVTEKQYQIIKHSCELYGRVQILQFSDLTDVIAEAVFPYHDGNTVDKEKFKTHIKLRDRLRDILDEYVRQCRSLIDNSIYPNDAQTALDIWAKMDQRRQDNFVMGTEPPIKIEIIDV